MSVGCRIKQGFLHLFKRAVMIMKIASHVFEVLLIEGKLMSSDFSLECHLWITMGPRRNG